MILIELFKYFIFLCFALFLIRFAIFIVLSLVTEKNVAGIFLGYLSIFSRNFNPTKKEFDGLIKGYETEENEQ